MAVSPPDANALVRLRQIYETAGWVLIESTLADIPSDLRWLFESGAVSLEQLAQLHRSLGVTTATDVAAAARESRIAALLGADVESAVADAIPSVRERTARVPLGRAVAVTEPMLERLRESPHVRWAEPAGSLRRGDDLVGNVELVVASDSPAEVIDEFVESLDVTRWLHRSIDRAYVLIERLQVGVRVAHPDNAGAVLLQLTGAPAHLEALRSHAESRGWRLSTAGLQTPEGTLHPAPVEDDIYTTLQLQVVPAEIRHTGREVVLAARGELPAFLTRQNIRGDLHMHTTWSDGRDSVEGMVVACRELGYEYLAITDHSPHSAASRNLSIEDVSEQAEEIARLRERYPDIAILHGTEVDILADGSLDFPDRVLERFDIVLASLHERAGHGPERLLERYLGAMRHPLVTLITHPTNRIVPLRDKYDLDYGRLFDAAAETNTLVEIDGSPSHLDLDGDLARQAVAAGAMVCVDSDCHRADLLDRQMRLGVLMARRGWVEPRHVVNTRPLAEVRRALAAKRG